MNAGEIVKKRREELNMSQEKLAEKLGYKSRSSINKIELGLSDIPFSKIHDFAKHLKMKSEDLISVNFSKEKTDIETQTTTKEYQLTPSELAEFEKLKNMQTSLFLFNDKQLSAAAMEKFEQALLEAFIDTIKQRKGDTNK